MNGFRRNNGKPDELMSVESDEKNIIIKLPIDLLVHSQGFRDSGYLILDEKSMAEYFKKMFLHSNRRQLFGCWF